MRHDHVVAPNPSVKPTKPTKPAKPANLAVPAGPDPAPARSDAPRPGTVERYAFVAFVILFAATWWRPQWPAEQALHDAGTLLALAALLAVRRRLRLPTSSVLLVLVFLALHTLAARWLYSYVPYDEWSRALFGRALSGVFGWHRNHFDRLVHFTYGLCAAPVVLGYLHRERGWRVWSAAVRSVEVVVATSALYELLEWGLAVLLSPAAAEAYNGQQGDVWDAHKDMAIAIAGAVLAAVCRAASRGSVPDRERSHVRP